MKLLNRKVFMSEVRAINMQNLILSIGISILLINEVLIYKFSIDRFWVAMNSGLLYCVAQMMVYN